MLDEKEALIATFAQPTTSSLPEAIAVQVRGRGLEADSL